MIRTTATLILSGLLLSACTQPAVQVVDKGKDFFGKNSSQVAASNNYHRQQQLVEAPIEAPTYQASARLDSMSVSSVDIAEPITVAALPEPRIKARPATPKPALDIAELAPLEPVTQTAAIVSFQPAIEEAAKVQPKLTSLNKTDDHFIWPVEGKIISHFGPKKNGLVNDGINISASEGEPIWAASKGEVVYAGNELKGYGNMVIMRHSNGWMTAYAHASDVLVAKGDRIAQGDLIGYVGSTGTVKQPQLHFGIREGKTAVNPEELLPRRLASIN